MVYVGALQCLDRKQALLYCMICIVSNLIKANAQNVSSFPEIES